MVLQNTCSCFNCWANWQRQGLWTLQHEKASQEIKANHNNRCHDCLQDYSIAFHIYTITSDHQLRAAVIQKGKPLLHYSKKLLTEQQNYSKPKGIMSYCHYTNQYGLLDCDSLHWWSYEPYFEDSCLLIHFVLTTLCQSVWLPADLYSW